MDPFCYLCFTFVFIIYCLVSLQLGKCWSLDSLVCDVCVFVTFPYGVSVKGVVLDFIDS